MSIFVEKIKLIQNSKNLYFPIINKKIGSSAKPSWAPENNVEEQQQKTENKNKSQDSNSEDDNECSWVVTEKTKNNKKSQKHEKMHFSEVNKDVIEEKDNGVDFG